MAQMSTGSAGGVGSHGDGTYTVLIIVATVFVWVAAIFSMVQTVRMFGSLFPPSGG